MWGSCISSPVIKDRTTVGHWAKGQRAFKDDTQGRGTALGHFHLSKLLMSCYVTKDIIDKKKGSYWFNCLLQLGKLRLREKKMYLYTEMFSEEENF